MGNTTKPRFLSEQETKIRKKYNKFLTRMAEIQSEEPQTSPLSFKLEDKDKLILYGLYMQSKDGKCNDPQPDPEVNLADYYKWYSWSYFNDKTKAECNRYYCDYV